MILHPQARMRTPSRSVFKINKTQNQKKKHPLPTFFGKADRKDRRIRRDNKTKGEIKQAKKKNGNVGAQNEEKTERVMFSRRRMKRRGCVLFERARANLVRGRATKGRVFSLFKVVSLSASFPSGFPLFLTLIVLRLRPVRAPRRAPSTRRHTHGMERRRGPRAEGPFVHMAALYDVLR